MQITINGERRELTQDYTISEMLKNLELPVERIAIELNKQVVRRRDWENVKIKDADAVEIIYFVGGG